MSTKSNILICAVLVIAIFEYAQCDTSANLTAEVLAESAMLCQNQTKASDDDMEYILKDKAPETRTQSCLVSCFLKKSGIMNNNGTINTEGTLKMFEHLKDGKVDKALMKKMKDVLEACNKDQPDKDHCDAAKKYMICYIKKAKEAGIPLEE